MKYFIFLILAAASFFFSTQAGQPAPTYIVTIDPAIYDTSVLQSMKCMFFPSALSMNATNVSDGLNDLTMLYKAYRKKGTTTVDLFSISGKIGSVTLPLQSRDTGICTYLFSQTIVDADEGWECLRVFYEIDGPFNLFDDDGTQLLSDSGTAFYGFDGKDTYVIAKCSLRDPFNRPLAYKSWRFRTDIVHSQSPLQKQTAPFPQPVMTFGQRENFQISLAPMEGGRTSVQLLDCIGRRLMGKTFANSTGSTAAKDPGSQFSQTPFIAKTLAQAVQPAPTYAVSIDTSLYDKTNFEPSNCMFYPSAISGDATKATRKEYHLGTLYLAFRKKGTTTVDLFSMSGKIGSITLPKDQQFYSYLFSQKIIDADEGWECLASTNWIYGRFTLFDDDGSKLLSDTGTAFYGFDGKDTYVIAQYSFPDRYATMKYKSWRFRTNIAPPQSPSLPKRTSSFPQTMMTFGQTENYQIALKPGDGGEMSVRIFDRTGGLLYEKTIDDITKARRDTIDIFGRLQ